MILPTRSLFVVVSFLAVASCWTDRRGTSEPGRTEVERLVRAHATAWETGDTLLLHRIIHDDALLAYPRRRLGKVAWTAELSQFSKEHSGTRVYIHRILVDGEDFAVEWQFASTDRETGIRTAVSDAIIGRVKDGSIVLWKEYLDGRVLELQREGRLPLEEGSEPFPWPQVR